jgi:hypothetical protein
MHVGEMLCEYILTDRETSTMVHRKLFVARNLKLIQSFFCQVLLPEKPSWLAWLGSDTAWFRQFSYDSIQTSPDESNLKFDVILAFYKCDLACL